MAYDQNALSEPCVLADNNDCWSNLGYCIGNRSFDWFNSAATSIQEMTLSFVPKLFVVLGAMALFATYTLSTMTDYFIFIFDEIALKGL